MLSPSSSADVNTNPFLEVSNAPHRYDAGVDRCPASPDSCAGSGARPLRSRSRSCRRNRQQYRHRHGQTRPVTYHERRRAAVRHDDDHRSLGGERAGRGACDETWRHAEGQCRQPVAAKRSHVGSRLARAAAWSGIRSRLHGPRSCLSPGGARRDRQAPGPDDGECRAAQTAGRCAPGDRHASRACETGPGPARRAGQDGEVIVGLWLLLAALTAPPKTHTVEIRGMEFHPAVLTVAVGDTIVWINRDIAPHTATAKGQTSWDTGQLAQGQVWRYVATRAGVAHYVCTFHPTMHGKVVIR